MSRTEQIAIAINQDIKNGKTIAEIKTGLQADDAQWQRYSAKAYGLNLTAEKAKRKVDESKPHVSTTSSAEMDRIVGLNTNLVNFAIILPITATISEFEYAARLADLLPASESELMALVERLTMQPMFRARQKLGRFEEFPYFKPVAKLIDAATLSYFRQNYISCYLTLVPVIEGILLRWLGYGGGADKPEFEKLKKFFRNGYQRQPMPWNIQFHEIFSKGCGDLLEQHFFRDSLRGTAHARFNRHLAAHLLEDGTFATKQNCLRLFMLLDAMTEIYFYESRGDDPRFSLHHQQTDSFMMTLATLMIAQSSQSPENIWF
jgi:hypothetical protein